MIFNSTLVPAILTRRYKRFLADVVLENGENITVYCPNTGSMRTCSEPGSKVCISNSMNSKRKYPFTLEMIEVNGDWVGVNTGLTNLIVAEAIEGGEIVEIAEVDSIQREVTVSPGTRLDIMVKSGGKKVFIEVKNCSMVEQGIAMFPDAVTARGTKHLLELEKLCRQGHEAIIFYLVQRMDAKLFKPAEKIDALYADTLRTVSKKGVKILVYQAEVNPGGISVVGELPYSLD